MAKRSKESDLRIFEFLRSKINNLLYWFYAIFSIIEVIKLNSSCHRTYLICIHFEQTSTILFVLHFDNCLTNFRKSKIVLSIFLLNFVK